MSKLDKNQFKTLGDALGDPTDYDKERIRRIILRYEKKYPGRLKAEIERNKKMMQESTNAFNNMRDFGIVEKETNRAHIFELPEELYNDIEKLIPTIFRERRHFQWFVKNFKELMLPDRYQPRKGYKNWKK